MTIKATVEEDIAFDDPDAWGFCACCAFQVAVDLVTRRMMPHTVGFITQSVCSGSGWEPDVQEAPEMQPKRVHSYPYEVPTSPTTTYGSKIPGVKVTMEVTSNGGAAET